MTPGDVFFLTIADSHRFFVVYAELPPLAKVVVLNFTTHYPGKCDETCIVTPAEYSGINHDSVIAYRHGLVLEGDELRNFRARMGTSLPSIGTVTLDKIVLGALTSPFTARKIKRLLEP